MIDPTKRLVYQRESKAWADSLDGKRVIVFFDINVHPCYASPDSEHNILGIAERIKHHYKWGRIRVYISREEYYRIVETRPDWNPTQVVRMSVAEPWGLEVKLDLEGRWYTDIIWSCRNSVRNFESISKEFVMERFRNGTSSIEAAGRV